MLGAEWITGYITFTGTIFIGGSIFITPQATKRAECIINR